jgi:DNA-binding response OmpR family regulator
LLTAEWSRSASVSGSQLDGFRKFFGNSDDAAPLDAPRLGFGNFSLDPANRILVTSEGTVVPMTRRVFDTLWVLAESRGALVTKDNLFERV